MTQSVSRDDISLYVMGAYDGDVAALEARIAEDAAAREMLAEEAALELSLREAAAAGTFCPNCDDLVADTDEPVRCASCGAAVKPGGYTVERVIVANAHGRMYVARDADGRQVALKELAFVQSPSTETIAAFEREAKFLRALEHPAIPRFLAAFEEGSGVHTRYYLAQELVDGTALDTRLDEHFYSEAEIVEIARQVLGVLVYLQGLSPMVIHRDIKPANLLRRPDGKIAVVDFGAAHVQGTTAGSTSIGTFGYMPLEQLAGEVGPTTDTYALGASLVHLLTRREPWRVFGPATFESINVSPALRQFLAKCVAPEPKDRFANAAAALSGLDAPAAVVAPKRRIPFGAWKVGAAVLAAAVTLGGAGLAGYALRGDPAQSNEPSLGGATYGIPFGEFPHFGDKADALRARQRVEEMLLKYGEAKDVDPPVAPPPRFVSESLIDLDFKAAQLPVVLKTIGLACGVNIVIPSHLQASVTVKTKETPCSDIFEVILEAHGLGYAYDPDANLVRIAPRKELQREREEAVDRAVNREQLGVVDDALPAGAAIDFDMRDVQLQDLLSALGNAGKVNIVVPDHIRGQVTIMAKGVRWDAALRAVLASQGLWFRYRPEGRILRVAPRKELDREDEEALEDPSSRIAPVAPKTAAIPAAPTPPIPSPVAPVAPPAPQVVRIVKAQVVGDAVIVTVGAGSKKGVAKTWGATVLDADKHPAGECEVVKVDELTMSCRVHLSMDQVKQASGVRLSPR